tara:strand:- start:144 stop:713 length:570 start_codon:yes stop_codon:yes gene_type:complete
MTNLPAEWQNNNGNLNGLNANNDMNERVHRSIRGLIHIRQAAPLITVPQLQPSQTRALNKDFTNGIDQDFKIRSSQLSDVYFKDTPSLIGVNDNILTGHYTPSFVYADNDFHSSPIQQIQPINTRNEFGFDRTATKDLNYINISPQEVMSSVSNNNSLRHVSFQGNRHSAARTPIVPIKQNRDKIVVIS